MKIALAFAVLAAGAGEGGAFVPTTKANLTPRTLAFATTAGNGENESSLSSSLPKYLSSANPAEAFGAPLSQREQEFNTVAVGLLKRVIFDTLFAPPTGRNVTPARLREREYARFYALETIARVPYFAYLSVLHFYETIGQWRRANYLKIHFAESWNELHHLLIMEELGGATRWTDRFVAQHVGVFYHWIVVLLYLWNPTFCYNLNEAVEKHAYGTYDLFLQQHKADLSQLPAPQVAKDYYQDGDLYMFDAMQTDNCQSPRRPPIRNLYDVFCAIRDDEGQHVKTMQYLQTEGLQVQSSHDETCTVPPPAGVWGAEAL